MVPRSAATSALSALRAVLLLAALGPGAARGGEPAPVSPYSLGRPALHIYTDRDGLPNNTVMALEVDGRGYLWLGSEDGLAVYNGRAWTKVRFPAEARSTYVRDILSASDGTLWLATASGGLLELRDGRWTIHDTHTGFPSDAVRALLETKSATGRPILWVATLGRGIMRLEDGHWTTLDRASGLSEERITGLLETIDAAGVKTLWVGTEGGLARYRDGAWTKFAAAPGGLVHNWVRALIETVSPEGARELWVGTDGGGLSRLTGDTWETFDSRNGLPSNQVMSLHASTGPDGRRETVWVGTYGGGLARYEGGRWTTWDSAWGMPSDSVRSILEMRSPEGMRTLWFGTQGGGLVRAASGNWRSFDTRSGLPNNQITGFTEAPEKDGSQALWIATYKGLARLRRGVFTSYGEGSGLPNLQVMTVRPAREPGALWVGTYGGGLARLEDGRWTVTNRTSGLPSDKVMAVLDTVDEGGRPVLWVGTYGGGLARRQDGRWTVIDSRNGGWDTAVAVVQTTDREGHPTLWVGTNGEGVGSIRDGVVVKDTVSPNLNVLTFKETRNNGRHILWVGTRGSGLIWRDLDDATQAWRALAENTSPALPNNVVYQVQEDAQGRIYAFTSRGVARLTPTRDGAFEPADWSVRTYTIAEGLPSNQCSYNGSLVDSAGLVWAGTMAGAAVFDPKSEVLDRTPKPLYVEAARTGNGAPLLPGAELPHDQNDAVFEYALLSFFREDDTRYRTQLVGFDTVPAEWSNDWKRTYTNLNPGAYVFRVWGRDYAGNLSGPVDLAFTIRTAPWRTPQALALYALFALGAANLLVRLRERALRRRNDLLEERVAARTAEIAEKVRELEESETRAHRATEEALQASQAKSAFLARMSHELRTPLNAILGFVQLMQFRPGRSTEEQEYLQIVATSGEHLLGLINDVLNLSKIEAGRFTLTERSFVPADMLREIDALFRLPADLKGLAFSLEAAQVPAQVLGDDGKLRQVLMNLLGNAIKFTRRGSVALRVSWSGDRASFAVADTGPGLEPDEQARVFEAFYQSQEGRRSGEGTGLGLAISRSFVSLMGGELRIESVPGQGATFRFDIPLPTVAVAAEEPARQILRGLAPGQPAFRILTVDDRAENRLLMVRLLEGAGFAVRTASDGDDALSVWEEWAPNLVLMDLRMPGRDGYDATREIRRREAAEPHRPRTVVVALTASAFEQDREAVAAAGCDDIVTKPFPQHVLWSILQRWLGAHFLTDAPEPATAPPPEPEVTPAAEAGPLAHLPAGAVSALRAALRARDRAGALTAVQDIMAHDETLGWRLRMLLEDDLFEDAQQLTE